MKKDWITTTGFAALAGVSGFLIGKVIPSQQAAADSITAGSPNITEGLPTKSADFAHDTAGPSKGLGYELLRDPRKSLRKLIQNADISALGTIDIRSQVNIWNMVKDLDSSQLATLAADVGNNNRGSMELSSVSSLIFSQWVKKDPYAAIQSAFSKKQGPLVAKDAITFWMREDPEAAFEWVQNNPKKIKQAGGILGVDQAELEAQYYINFASKNFESTLGQLDKMGRKTRGEVVKRLAKKAQEDPAQQKQLFAHLKQHNPELLKKARERFVSGLSYKEPHRALEFIESENLQPATQAKLERKVLSEWRLEDPETALKWEVEKFHGAEDIGDKVAKSFGEWVEKDEEQAAEWLTAQGEEYQTDSVFEEAGDGLLYKKDYERAALWFDQILDKNERESAFRNLYQEWQENDAEGAEQWRKQLPLEEQELLTPER